MNCDFIEEIKYLENLKSFPTQPVFSENMMKKQKIIVYGGGNGFITLSMFVLQRFNIIPEIVFDKKYSVSERRNGTLFCHPDHFVPSKEILEKSLVIISLGNAEIRQQVKSTLVKHGYKNVISAVDIYEYHLPNPSPEIHQGFCFYKNAFPEIMQVLGLLKDENSREIFKQFLFTHLYRKRLDIPSEPVENQYFPLDIWDNSVYDRTIICGAYDGDTSLAIFKRIPQVNSMICIEPDPENFEKMQKNIQPYKGNVKKLVLLPLGVYDKNVQMRFASGNVSNCAIAEDGDLLIQCVALDDCLPDEAPTLISMDVEGVELQALRGMTKIIKKHRPKLAICVYHSPEHIWKIPLFLHEIVPDYQFCLRNYSSFTSETVLYAW